jgi:hypothetical protein
MRVQLQDLFVMGKRKANERRTQMLTQDRIDEIWKREQAATEGPWWWINAKTCLINKKESVLQPILYGQEDFSILANNNEDKDFIAHARQDIPDLLAEVERLQAENERLKYNPAVELSGDASRSFMLALELSEAKEAAKKLEAENQLLQIMLKKG